MSTNYSRVETTAREYYNSSDADNFYFHVWGGEDIHIGIYDDPSITIARASQITVMKMAEKLKGLSSSHSVIDIGAGYGGSARQVAKAFGCKVTCINISEVENERNREFNKEQKLDHLITVEDASFENIPAEDSIFDFAWSQDAILHSGNRVKVIEEVSRVLKPGGEFVFTDPMQSDDADISMLQPVLERIHLDTMGSFSFYIETAKKFGFEIIEIEDLTKNLIQHYSRVHDELVSRNAEIKEHVSDAYIERMKVGLNNWIKAGENGQLSWGIIHLRKK